VTAKDTSTGTKTRPDNELKALAEGAVGGISLQRELSARGLEAKQATGAPEQTDVTAESDEKATQHSHPRGTGFHRTEASGVRDCGGHQVTLLNRNRTRPDFFKGRVEQLIGDLNADVSALKGKKFDVVIDNPNDAAGVVKNAAQYLKGKRSLHLHLDRSVYQKRQDALGRRKRRHDADAPEVADPTPSNGRIGGNTTARSRRSRRRKVQETISGMNTIIRPGLIVGPLDTSDRFTVLALPESTKAARCCAGTGTILCRSSTPAISPSGRCAWRRTGRSGHTTPLVRSSHLRWRDALRHQAVTTSGAHSPGFLRVFSRSRSRGVDAHAVWTPDSTRRYRIVEA